MNRKYIFFDIDGTLTDHKSKKVVDSALEAVDRLKKSGHFVAIATGRAHYKARWVSQELHIDNLVANGGNSLVVDGSLVENEPLPLDRAKALINQAEQLGYGILLALDDSEDVYSKDDLFIRQFGDRKEPTNYIIDRNLDYDALDRIYKIYVSIPEVKQHLLTSLDGLGHLRYLHDYLIVQPDNKKNGIIRMMNHLQAPLDDVIVFGDDVNDLVMFDAPWTKIAMGNGHTLLKQRADFVTLENVQGGIHYACEYYKLW